MITDNSGRIKRISRIFYLGAALFALGALLFFLTGRDIAGFIAVAAVVVWFLIFQAVDFQFVSVESSDAKFTLRYYSVARFGKREYRMIEFPLSSLYDYRLEKSLFGLVRDLILVVKTRQGFAEYESVSLAGLTRDEREQLETELKRLRNR